jgi:WD40 repeat protein
LESAENIWIRFIPVWCGSPSSAIGRFRFASVLGREFRLDVLARVGAFDEDELLDALEAAQRAGLIRAAQNSSVMIPSPGKLCLFLPVFQQGNWIIQGTASGSPTFHIRTGRSGAAGQTVSDRLQLTYAPVFAGLPRWSTQIAYSATQPGKPWTIFLVPAQGGTPQELLSETSNEVDAAWSPDGQKLAFGRFAESRPEGIHVVDLATRHVSLIPGSEKLFSPRWSPDGQYLAALNTESTKIVLFNWKTQTWSDWVTESGAFAFPNWSQDGKYLYYDIAFTEHQTFRRVKVSQNHSELIADLKGLLRYDAAPAFTWSGLAPDRSALFDRDLSTDEIYAVDGELP